MRIALISALIPLLALASGPADAVRRSADDQGEVLIAPVFVAGVGLESTLTIRNSDPVFAKAVRVAFKDPVNGRPTLTLNVYLTPGDSWTATLRDVNPDTSLFQNSRGVLSPWSDTSCTLPRREDVPAEGLRLAADFLDEGFAGPISPNRIAQGTIEIYDMGGLTPALAANCDSIENRFEAPEGLWNVGAGEYANFGLSRPQGGLSASVAIVDTRKGIPYQFDALALTDFSDLPLHTHPSEVRTPSLLDVGPPVSTRINADGSTVTTDWSDNPIGAVDAVLMADHLGAEYVASEPDDAEAFLAIAFPTAAYHLDGAGFYGGALDPAPFSVDAVIADGSQVGGPALDIQARDDAGQAAPLVPTSDFGCDRIRGALFSVSLTNSAFFVTPCRLGEADLLVPSSSRRGEVTIRLPGSLVAADGSRIDGLPAVGLLLQSFRPEDRPDYGWATPLRTRNTPYD